MAPPSFYTSVPPLSLHDVLPIFAELHLLQRLVDAFARLDEAALRGQRDQDRQLAQRFRLFRPLAGQQLFQIPRDAAAGHRHVEMRIGAIGDQRVAVSHHRLGDVDMQVEAGDDGYIRSEEHTSELPSLMRISYAVFCLEKPNYFPAYIPDTQLR